MSLKLYQFNNSSNNNSINSSFNTKKKHLKKFNIIFDIDETLVQTLILSNLKTKKMIYSHNEGNIVVSNYPKKNGSVVFLRPGLYELLAYCFYNFHVSFWTTGVKDYCQGIIDQILTEKQFNQTKVILSRYDENTVYDLKTKKKYKIDKFNDNMTKPLDFLFTHQIYKNKFKKSNTILIDDNPLHIAVNHNNGIFIFPWCRYDKKDNKLITLLESLKKNRDIKNINELKINREALFIPDNKNLRNITAHECRKSSEFIDEIFKKPRKKSKKKSLSNKK